MRKIIIVMMVLLTGCYTLKQADADKKKHATSSKKTVKLQYKYKIISPVENDQMSYEDSNINASFIIGDKEIDFTLKNKTLNPLKVNWDDASMAIFGNSNKIMHNGIKYTDRNNSMAPTTILPNTMLDDLALPTDNVYYSEGFYSSSVTIPSSWKTNPLLISKIYMPKDSTLLESLKSQEITLYLPITDINNKNIGYTFKFKVSDIIMK